MLGGTNYLDSIHSMKTLLQTLHSPFLFYKGINILGFIIIIHFLRPSIVNMICLICCIIYSHKVLFITYSNFVPFLLFVCFDDPLTAICVRFYSGPFPFISNFLSPPQFLLSHSLPPSPTAILTAVFSLLSSPREIFHVKRQTHMCTHKAESENGTPYLNWFETYVLLHLMYSLWHGWDCKGLSL